MTDGFASFGAGLASRHGHIPEISQLTASATTPKMTSATRLIPG